MSISRDTILTLSLTRSFGYRDLRVVLPVLDQYQVVTPADLQSVLAMAIPTLSGMPPFPLSDLQHAFDEAARVKDWCASNGVRYLAGACGDLPATLTCIPDPPLVLYVAGGGDLPELDKAVAVVGTREATKFGLSSAQVIAARLAGQGLTVVSGLALGIDTAAHRGALSVAEGKTIAVLAHGLDTIYPLDNWDLAEAIVDKGGLLCSEYPPGVHISRVNLVKRDRLQSGLSGGVIVVETGATGGTWHTVRYAREQKRSLGVVVHPEDLRGVPSVAGNQMLLGEAGVVPLADKAALFRFANGPRVGLSSI